MSDSESNDVIMYECEAPEQPSSLSTENDSTSLTTNKEPRSSIRNGEPSLSIRNEEQSSVIVMDKPTSSNKEPISLYTSNEESSASASNEEPCSMYTTNEESSASASNEEPGSLYTINEESSASASNEEPYSLTVKDKNHVPSGSTDGQSISSDAENENSFIYCTKNLSCISKNIESDSFDLEEYALYKHTLNLMTRPYYTKFLLETNDYERAETEYDKFLEFIESYPEPGKTQLSALIFPLFVHVYLFLLTNPDDSRTLIAEKFYESFSFYFKDLGDYEELLKELFQLKSFKKVKNHKYFKKFWKMKYICRLPFDVLTNFKLSLEKSESRMLIRILHFHFFFEDVDFRSLINLSHIRSSEVVEKDDSVANIRCFDDLDEMWKTQMCCLSTSEIVIRHNSSNIASVDVCDSFKEIAVTYSCAYISVAPIEKVSEKTSDHYKIGRAKKINLPGVVSIVKYVPGSRNKVLVVIDARVLLLNTSTGKIEYEFDAHHNSILDLDISLLNEQFATGGKDGKVVLWYFSQETMIKEFPHDYSVEVVKFHPNGLYLATGCCNLIRLWYVTENYCVRVFVGHAVKINIITFSPNGKMLASSDIVGRIKVWDIKESCVISESSGYANNKELPNKITCLCFSNDSCFTLASTYRRNIIVLDSRDRKTYYEHEQKHIPLLIRPFENGLLVVCKENSK